MRKSKSIIFECKGKTFSEDNLISLIYESILNENPALVAAAAEGAESGVAVEGAESGTAVEGETIATGAEGGTTGTLQNNTLQNINKSLQPSQKVIDTVKEPINTFTDGFKSSFRWGVDPSKEINRINNASQTQPTSPNPADPTPKINMPNAFGNSGTGTNNNNNNNTV